ncbi:hypothetical protein CYY_001888 [Polysphondylium violaceum]|uniref:CCAAT-binding factor domain-containing protein n=1 Tax=Polysphondylium violaceum TaxID=133409 RepID=A0A8J4Q8L6_9MYCE|nr:hypothetical protein CYY_001888 [Polysphondylium violaceum]
MVETKKSNNKPTTANSNKKGGKPAATVNNNKQQPKKQQQPQQPQQQSEPVKKNTRATDTATKKYFGNSKKSEKPATTPVGADKSTTKNTTATTTNKNTKNNTTTKQSNEKKTKQPTKSTTTAPTTDSDNIKLNYGTNVENRKHPLYTKAEEAFKQKLDHFQTEFKKSSSRDDQWKEKIQSTGTIRDRISAITLLVQKAPMYRISSLDILLNLAAKKSEREREFAVNSLKDLFINSLLPDSKLKRFYERIPNINEKTVKQEELSQWYFEDMLKARYQAFIGLLEVLSKDTVARIRIIAAATIQYLLMKKPEQEEVLLTLLVNKLGDEDATNVSKITNFLVKLLEAHPGMKNVIIREIEMFLYRANNAAKAQYNALFFLNKIQVLAEKDSTSVTELNEMSNRLINLYFTFFTTKSQAGSSCISLILFGIRKAYANVKDTTKLEPKQLDALFKSLRKNSINKVIQTLCLLFEIKLHTPEISDEFYQNLYYTLNRIEHLSQFDQTSFLNLIFRAIKHDDDINRSKAMIKRLLQFSFYQKVSFSASCLILLSELIRFNNSFGEMISVAQVPSIEEEQEQEQENQEEKFNIKTYDCYHNNPKIVKAETTCLWEINLYKDHDHPTVSGFANDLLNARPIKFQGNPTGMFTLHAFLEKFVLARPRAKNAKGSQLAVTKSGIKSKYIDGEEDEDQDAQQDNVPEIDASNPSDKFLQTFGDISSAVPQKSKKKIEFEKDEDEIDKALGYNTEADQDEDFDMDEMEEYSYSDLEDEDFEDEEVEFETPKQKVDKKPTKKVQNDSDDDQDVDQDDEQDDGEDFNIDEQDLYNDDLLGSIYDEDDADVDDLEIDDDLGSDDEEEEEEEVENDIPMNKKSSGKQQQKQQAQSKNKKNQKQEEQETNIDTPDFGDEDDDDDQEDDDDEGFVPADSDDELAGDSDDDNGFMDADDFAALLDSSGKLPQSKNQFLSKKKPVAASKNTKQTFSKKAASGAKGKRKRA